MPVVGLELLGVLEDVLGVLLAEPVGLDGAELDLLDLLDGLELDEEDDRVDLVRVQALHQLQVDAQDAVESL